jgi:hypothetical protein
MKTHFDTLDIVEKVTRKLRELPQSMQADARIEIAWFNGAYVRVSGHSQEWYEYVASLAGGAPVRWYGDNPVDQQAHVSHVDPSGVEWVAIVRQSWFTPVGLLDFCAKVAGSKVTA